MQKVSMNRRFSHAAWPILLLLMLVACSSANPDAPLDGQVHPQNYLVDHSAEAAADIDACKSCHGGDLNGRNHAVSCLTCHIDGEPIVTHATPYSDPLDHGAAAREGLRQCFGCHGTAPDRFDGGVLADPDRYHSAVGNCSAVECHGDAGAHPTRWQGSNDNTPGFQASHRTVSQPAIDTGCAMCHQVAVDGPMPRNDAPSCFSAGFSNGDGSTTGCHASGPGTTHDLPYDTAELHGAAAKADLAACQTCHGIPDSTAFSGGSSGISCVVCHTTAAAHPTRWQGTNDLTTDYLSTHRDAGKQSTACAICHEVVSGSPGPNPGAPSCFSATFSNGDGSTTGCHASGPGTTHDLPYDTAELHGAAAKADLAACQTCHGTPGGTNFSGGSSGISCAACHPAAAAHPTRWQGTNDLTTDYLSTHRDAGKQSTTCAICHEVVSGSPGPNPGAPSCFSATFTNGDGSTTGCHASGPGAPHPVPYTDPLQHGVDAKDNFSSCVPCHAAPADAGPGDNPRFNLAIGDLTNGCEDCHAVNTAHPTSLWTGPAATSHRTASRMDTACALCHGINLDGSAGGGVGPACSDCHTAGSPLTQTSCTSCHNRPPDGQSPAGNQYPNRDGSHSVHTALAGVSSNCQVCHQGAGTESAVHFNGGDPAAVSLTSSYDAQSGAASYNAANQTCASTRCHGGQTSPAWYSGSIDVDTDCQSCHSTSSGQYNSATSGRHRLHVDDRNYDCTLCHNTSLLEADHFSNLATTGFEGNPWETLNAFLNYNHATRSGCSVAGCHGSENWN